MTPARRRIKRAIVPAAGLGTRLSPLTLGVAKELLPLGRYPALCATLLEAEAAEIEELAVVVSPQKEGVARFLQRFEFARRFRIQLVEQPNPAGVLDAVERGLAAFAPADDAAVAVLFPDLLHLPDQTALRRLCAGHALCGEAVYGLRVAVAGEPSTPTVAVRLAEPLRAELPVRIAAIERASGAPGEILTTFGQIHTPAFGDAIERTCRPAAGALLEDAHLLAAINDLAAAGKLYGVLLPGEVLDLGTLPGYLDAAARFLSGRAKLRMLTET